MLIFDSVFMERSVFVETLQHDC